MAEPSEPGVPDGTDDPRGHRPLVRRADVEQARDRIAPWVRVTPVIRVDARAGRHPGGGAGSGPQSGARAPGHTSQPVPVVLKLEQLQHTGSFKVRGMVNRLRTADVSDAGVVIASGGNAGLALAHAAARLGHPAQVFVPTGAPESKVHRIRAMGATVDLVGDEYADALEASLDFSQRRGALLVHAYDQEDVVAGQGTCAAELSDQAPELDTVLVAVGGGGLIGGTAAWYEGSVRVVAVEPRRCPTLSEALRRGQPVDVAVGGVAADALGARRIGRVAWSVAGRDPTAPPWIAESLLVDDDAIVAARRWLWEHVRVAAEHGGATALAPLLTGDYQIREGERVGVIVCGANTDLASLQPPPGRL